MDSEGESGIQDTEETYLFIDFGEKVHNDVFQKEVFLRIANLNTENPLIQLNDQLFKGEFEDCIGTNIFFEDIKEAVPRMTFGAEGSIRLKHTVTQFKTLTTKLLRLPPKLKDIPKPDYDIQIKTETDYQTILKKLANGSLDLGENLKIVYPTEETEIVTKENDKIGEEKLKTSECPKEQIQTDPPKKTDDVDLVKQMKHVEIRNEWVEDGRPIDILVHKYQKLQKLARRPTRRKIELDDIEPCDPKYQKAYEYDSIKSQIIKPSDHFERITKDFNRDTLVGAVDIDRSVLQGVIKPSTEFYRELTEDEKRDLLSMENLPNLSIPARFWVLKTQLEHLESVISQKSSDELAEKDKYGRTLEETAEIYRRLSKVLNGLIEPNISCNSDGHSENECESGDNSGESVDVDLNK